MICLFFLFKEIEQMSARNFDSSLLTQRRRDNTLGAYANYVNTAVNASGGVATVRRTQPTLQSGEVVTEQNLGNSCSRAPQGTAANPYPFNPSGGQCSC